MSKNNEIGYKKPPAHTRFKKGQSGNPAGRPKGTVKVVDVDAALDEALSALIPVNENGRVRKISKLRALMTQTVNKGLKGHHPSANLILSFKAKRDGGAESDSFDAGRTDEEARKEFAAFLDEMATNLSKGPSAAKQQNDNSPEDLPKPDREDKDPSSAEE